MPVPGMSMKFVFAGVDLDLTTFLVGVALCIAHRVIACILSRSRSTASKKVEDFETWEEYEGADCKPAHLERRRRLAQGLLVFLACGLAGSAVMRAGSTSGSTIVAGPTAETLQRFGESTNLTERFGESTNLTEVNTSYEVPEYFQEPESEDSNEVPEYFEEPENQHSDDEWEESYDDLEEEDLNVAELILEQELEEAEEVQEVEEVVMASPISVPLIKYHRPKDLPRFHVSSYYGTVYIGTPPKPFTVVFDTGSGQIVLPSAQCDTHQCAVHKRYDSEASSTAERIHIHGGSVEEDEPHEWITIQYGTGQVRGPFVKDNVCVHDTTALESDKAPGSANNTGDEGTSSANESENTEDGQEEGAGKDQEEEENVKGCVDMGFITAAEMSEKPFSKFHFDGIIGLALPALSETPGYNFIHVMSLFGGGAGKLRETFAMFLGRGEEEKESELTLGGWDSSRIVEELTWNRVHRPEFGHWIIAVKALKVDGIPLSFCADGCRAVLDSGTPMLGVPPAIFPQMYRALRHIPEDDCGCTGLSPRLDFEFEESVVSLSAEDFTELHRVSNTLPPNASAEVKMTSAADVGLNKDETPEFCKPMLMALDIPKPLGPKLFILGESVLQKYYAVYDAGEMRVGLARAKRRS